ncbi:MAG: mercury(II) reductase [Candidatus Helarchaeota archaeon]
MKKYDLIIIGGGAAGFAAAMKANELNDNTLLVNNKLIGIGGTCVNVGCVPTKFLLNISDLITKLKSQKFYGINSSVSFEYDKIIEDKNKLIYNLQNEKYLNILKELPNVQYFEGNAEFISNSKIKIDNQEIFQADKFIIATGSSTFIPPINNIENINYLTNIEALQLKKLPKSLVILGGGALGLEFAQLFSRFGIKVSILEMLDKIIPNEEPEISELLKTYLEDEDIRIFTGVKITNITNNNNEIKINVIINGNEKIIRAEKVLLATGRRANTNHIGIEKLGIKLGNKGIIIVDEYMNAVENIWAAGDVIGDPMLETVAAREGMIAANNALSMNKIKMNYKIIPHAIFTNPQVASVGLTDAQANEQGYTCNCRTIPLKLIPKSIIIKEDKGAVKIVINNETQEVLGIHILSICAADLIHEGIMIIKNRMTIDDIINTVHIFPTLSEAIKLTSQSFRRDITKMSCCAE